MSTRLTNDMRDKIVSKLIRDRFFSEEQKLIKKREAFAKKVYNDVYSKKERDLMDSLPDNWLKKRDSIKVQFGSSYDIAYISFGERLPLPYKDDGRVVKIYDQEHNIAKQYKELKNKETMIREDKKNAESKAYSILNSVTTTGKLFSVWPEIEPTVSKMLPKSTCVPTINVEEVNKVFNLKEVKK